MNADLLFETAAVAPPVGRHLPKSWQTCRPGHNENVKLGKEIGQPREISSSAAEKICALRFQAHGHKTITLSVPMV
jgi:hypothetical protein